MPNAAQVALRKLNENQQTFVRLYARTGIANHACQAAGYANPDTEAYRLMKLPHVQAAIFEERARLIHTEGATIGYLAVLDMVKNVETPSATRFQAAKYLMELGGHTVKASDLKGEKGKALSEMTPDELQMFIAQSVAAAAAIQAVQIDATPDNAQFTDVDDETQQ